MLDEQDVGKLVAPVSDERFEAAAEEQPPTEATQTEGEGTPEPEVEKPAEVDYKARAEEQAKTIEKLQNDLKAERTGKQKQADRDKAIADEIASLREVVKANLRASGDTEALESFEKQERETRARQTQQTFAQVQQEVVSDILGIGKSLGVDANTDTNFEEVGELYKEAARTGNMAKLYEAKSKALETALRMRQEAGLPKETKTETPKPETKTPPTDLGAGAGGLGIPTLATLLKKDISKMSLGELREHEKQIKEAEKREGA